MAKGQEPKPERPSSDPDEFADGIPAGGPPKSKSSAPIPPTAQVALLQMAAELAERYDSTVPEILKDHGLKVTVTIA